ncbi:hypothetical protein GCM10029992_57820 [Glycomyces albus]
MNVLEQIITDVRADLERRENEVPLEAIREAAERADAPSTATPRSTAAA